MTGGGGGAFSDVLASRASVSEGCRVLAAALSRNRCASNAAQGGPGEGMSAVKLGVRCLWGADEVCLALGSWARRGVIRSPSGWPGSEGAPRGCAGCNVCGARQQTWQRGRRRGHARRERSQPRCCAKADGARWTGAGRRPTTLELDVRSGSGSAFDRSLTHPPTPARRPLKPAQQRTSSSQHGGPSWAAPAKPIPNHAPRARVPLPLTGPRRANLCPAERASLDETACPPRYIRERAPAPWRPPSCHFQR